MISLFIQLFCTFFLIGMFTFGGGYAVIGMIQSEIVVARGWISESAFTDIVAIAQVTPGPVGLNSSTYVGYEMMKEAGAGQLLACLGSLTASVAIVLPSFIIMLVIVKFYMKFRQSAGFKNVMGALKPAVAGLIGASALVLMFSVNPGEGVRIIADNFPDWKSWALFAAALAAYLSGKAGPVPILTAGAVLGIIFC